MIRDVDEEVFRENKRLAGDCVHILLSVQKKSAAAEDDIINVIELTKHVDVIHGFLGEANGES